MGLGHSPRIVTDGLVLCLDAANKRSYGGSGTTWTDLKGSNNGTLTNGTGFSNDNGGSLIFDGANDYIALGNASNFISSSQNTATVCAWVKPNSTGSYKKIFSVCNSGTNQIQSFYFSIGPNPYKVYMGLKTSSAVAAIHNIDLSTTEFTYLCAVYNGSTLKLYRNGLEVASQNQTGNIPTTGVGRISGYDNGGENWPGNIASFSMYNKALTADEVRQNYLATKERYA